MINCSRYLLLCVFCLHRIIYSKQNYYARTRYSNSAKEIAVEFDGMYWHSEENKPQNYHLNKTNLCEAKGIQLVHIFEKNEWLYKCGKLYEANVSPFVFIQDLSVRYYVIKD